MNPLCDGRTNFKTVVHEKAYIYKTSHKFSWTPNFHYKALDVLLLQGSCKLQPLQKGLIVVTTDSEAHCVLWVYSCS